MVGPCLCFPSLRPLRHYVRHDMDVQVQFRYAFISQHHQKVNIHPLSHQVPSAA